VEDVELEEKRRGQGDDWGGGGNQIQELNMNGAENILVANKY
jgi:hypothetical protein